LKDKHISKYRLKSYSGHYMDLYN